MIQENELIKMSLNVGGNNINTIATKISNSTLYKDYSEEIKSAHDVYSQHILRENKMLRNVLLNRSGTNINKKNEQPIDSKQVIVQVIPQDMMNIISESVKEIVAENKRVAKLNNDQKEISILSSELAKTTIDEPKKKIVIIKKEKTTKATKIKDDDSKSKITTPKKAPQEGYIYIVQRAKSISKNEPIYKIGRAKDLSKRLKTGYDQGVEVRYSRKVIDYVAVEKLCLQKLKEQFKLVEGREKFLGELSSMIQCVDSIVTKHALNK